MGFMQEGREGKRWEMQQPWFIMTKRNRRLLLQMLTGPATTENEGWSDCRIDRSPSQLGPSLLTALPNSDGSWVLFLLSVTLFIWIFSYKSLFLLFFLEIVWFSSVMVPRSIRVLNVTSELWSVVRQFKETSNKKKKAQKGSKICFNHGKKRERREKKNVLIIINQGEYKLFVCACIRG